MSYISLMHAFKARVHNGHLVMDEPTDFPEGTEVRLIAVDADDDLDEDERARLHAAIDEGVAELDAGHRIPASDVLARLSAK